MARIARVVVPEIPHHIIQRGNRSQKVFFNESDYSEYLKLLNNYSHRFKVDILAYCLIDERQSFFLSGDNYFSLCLVKKN